MTTLEYHRLRNTYVKSWNLQALEDAAGSQDPAFPEHVERLLLLPEEKPSGNPDAPGPAMLHPKLLELCQLYLSSTLEQRMFIRSRIDRRLGGRLLGFSYGAAILGLRQKSEQRLRVGLVAHAIEDLAAGDVRDNLVILTLLFDAAKRIGSDPSTLFREVAGTSAPAMSAVLLDYLKRDPQLQTPECMGFREVETPEGVGYQQVGLRIRKPHR